MAEPLNKAARNERRKITATAVNNVALAMFVTGVVVPLVNASPPRTPYWPWFALSWIAISLVLHAVARIILKGIDE